MHAPSARHWEVGPYRLQKASPNKSRVAPVNQGRHVSKAVKLPIQAPLIPSRTSTNGTTQQIDAPMAARLAPRMAGIEDLAGFVRMGAYYLPYPGTESSDESKNIHHQSTGRSEEHTSELQSLMRISYA